MALIFVALGAVIVYLLLVIVHLKAEIVQRDKHLAWVDKRDALLRDLAGAAVAATLIPKTNILAPWFERGMLSRNGKENAVMLLTESKERMDVYASHLQDITRAFKEIVHWEQRNPPPPLSPLPHGPERERLPSPAQSKKSLKTLEPTGFAERTGR